MIMLIGFISKYLENNVAQRESDKNTNKDISTT